MADDVKIGSEPMDRLTKLCAEMTTPLDRIENLDVKACVFLQDGDRGGIQMHGYEDPTEGMVDLFVHLQAMFKAIGKELHFVGIPDSPEELDD